MKFLLYILLLFNAFGLAAANDTVGREYNTIYKDSILAAKLPVYKLTHIAGLNPGKIAGTYTYDIQPILPQLNRSLVFAVFIFSIILFLIVKFLYPDYYAASVEGFISFNFFNQYYRLNEYNDGIPFILMALFRCTVFSLAGLLLWSILNRGEWYGVDRVYLKMFFFVAIGMFVKNFAELFFNYVAGSLAYAKPYFVQVNILFNVMTMIILPLLLVLFFIDNIALQILLYVFAGWAVLAVLLFLIRSLQVVPVRGLIYYLHFILYICAFEIIPWLLIGRLVWSETM